MPPALPDSLVGRASGPVGAERRSPQTVRTTRTRSPNQDDSSHDGPNRNERGGSTDSALEALLLDLGPQIRRGPAAFSAFSSASVAHEARRGPTGEVQARDADADLEGPPVCPTGLPTLDARLGGGFPHGRLSEICGAPSSGKTALALRLLSTTLRRGGLTGWVDRADAFDPLSASESGVDLERLLWVRPRSNKEALQSCDRILQTEGFELVVFDCGARASPGKDRAIPDVAWLRLARLAVKTGTTLVALSPEASTGSRAELVLEMQFHGAHFTDAPALLDSLETSAALRRHRLRPGSQSVPLRISVSPED